MTADARGTGGCLLRWIHKGADAALAQILFVIAKQQEANRRCGSVDPFQEPNAIEQ
jgi:hypothetical protein